MSISPAEQAVLSPRRTAWRTLLLQGGWAALFLALGAAFIWLVMNPYGYAGFLDSRRIRILAFGGAAGVGALVLKAGWRQRTWVECFLAAPALYGMLYKVAAFIPEVSTYPFSLGWSEGSRFYYGSLYLSKWIYGFSTPPTVLHPSRYLMQSLPFLLPSLPLWFHRLWQVGLWLVFSLGVAYLLVRRLNLPDRLHRALFVLWGALFLFQGPVYYHLLVMPALVLWGFDTQKPRRTWVVVLVASLWAGISRVNWLPVPGMLAAALYMLEVRKDGASIWRYFSLPAAWAVGGTVVGFLSQKAYEVLSGNPDYYFGSSFTSDLLWYRLKSSATYPLGVLPASLRVALPMLALIVFLVALRRLRHHPLRLLGLASILGVLFAGGVVVSVKIGGGSNLHNLDAFLLLLLVIGSYIYFGPFPEEHERVTAYPRWAPLLAVPALLAPFYFLLSTGGPLPVRDHQAAAAALAAVRAEVSQAVEQGGEVLFISERHLLAFDLRGEASLFPEYEKVFLMEMAMANNRPYLDRFQSDIFSQRFALIVSEPLRIQYQGRAWQFGEENDAWVAGVSEPVLCAYEPVLEINDPDLMLLAPKAGAAECP